MINRLNHINIIWVISLLIPLKLGGTISSEDGNENLQTDNDWSKVRPLLTRKIRVISKWLVDKKSGFAVQIHK